MSDDFPNILWTWTDEAPMLASCSLLPIVKAFTAAAGINVEARDISLAGRIIAAFPDELTEAQRQNDDLAELGALTQSPDANIIKLPNISASIPQLKAAIKELRSQDYPLPEYPDDPKTDSEREIKARYAKVLGSAVNPVLREGNSDRRAPASVKQYAQKNPHSMGAWSQSSRSHVATMSHGDFCANEQSVTMQTAADVRIEFIDREGGVKLLKEQVPLEAGEVVDATFMSRKALVEFLEDQVADAKQRDVLFSLHMKATMMKVSDPIIFGHAVKVFYREVIDKHAEAIQNLGVDFNNGIGDLYNKMEALPEADRMALEADIQSLYEHRPALAMVNSDKGVTNLHVPSDIIIDASMPAAIRASGQMWGPDGRQKDTKFVIPDHSYAPLYQAAIEHCIQYGALDPTVMGTVPNVGLMAKKAEEYGSHPTTFEIPDDGVVRIVSTEGHVIHEQQVEQGDIWRMVMVKDSAIQDWVRLAVNRARATRWPAVFWLGDERAHERELKQKVVRYLEEHDTKGLDIRIMSTYDAAKLSLERARAGENTISVTGNVLRDYTTDLFPILELGTSAKMLSVVPLMNGGGLFETGAGGSAPKHVQQFVQEGHLRWDSLGEFLALAAALEHLSDTTQNERARVLALTLDQATGMFLENNRSPSRRVNELDNRGSHFYLALYWAQALAEQAVDMQLQKQFKALAETLGSKEMDILEELSAAQGAPVDIGGYYHPQLDKIENAMRPSATFNAALSALG